MRMSLLCSVASVFLASTAAFAQGEGEYPATLKGHAVLPAQTFIDAPADAPDDLKTSGKYTTGKRIDAVGSVMGKSYERPTGVSLPGIVLCHASLIDGARLSGATDGRRRMEQRTLDGHTQELTYRPTLHG